MTKSRIVGALIGASVLFLSACGVEEGAGGEPSGVVEDSDDVGVGTPSEDPDDGGDDGAADGDGDEGGASDDEGASTGGDFASSLECERPYDGPESDLDTYTHTYLEANFELEQLVMELGQELERFEAGDANHDDFIAELEEISNEYNEIVAEPITMSPPDEGAQWHANAVESWVRVCETIVNAHEGLVNNNDPQYSKFKESLTTPPHLLNDLHANTMVGPGEDV